MAIGKKTGGRPFEPGNKLGQGRPPITPELREARAMNTAGLQLALSKFVNLKHGEVEELIRSSLHSTDPNAATSLCLAIARVLDKAIKSGDYKSIEFILERLIGKVPTQVETGENGFIIRVLDYSKGSE